MNQLPERDGSWTRLSGWRRVVGRALAFWYVSAFILAIVLTVVLWVMFVATDPFDPTKQYWSCMENQVQTFKPRRHDAGAVFSVADSFCGRPSGISDTEARSGWIRLWNEA